MVVERTMNNRRIVYKCDRCEEITTTPYKMFVQGPKEVRPKRKWDLCDRCYAALVRGINKGVKKVEVKENE